MIKSGIMHKQREICLLPIPFSDLSSNKRRPVLIISNDSYNSQSDDVLVMAITSNLHDKSTSVFIDQSDMQTGVLKSESMVRVDKIYSINNDLIIKSFGNIGNNKFGKIIENLISFLKETES